jgi:hypothetical protein
MSLNFSGATLQLYSQYSVFGNQPRGALRLSALTGCQDWAMQMMADVVQLQQWKSAAKARQSLSTKELARKSDELEIRLRKNLAALEENERHHTLSSKVSPQQAASNHITCVFARVTETLLQAVVSGFDADLLEIRESVEHTRAALEKIKERRLLVKLALPICISGSLASKSQEPFFQVILEALRDGCSKKYTIVQAILKESWELRDRKQESSFQHDWLKILGAHDFTLLVF